MCDVRRGFIPRAEGGGLWDPGESTVAADRTSRLPVDHERLVVLVLVVDMNLERISSSSFSSTYCCCCVASLGNDSLDGIVVVVARLLILLRAYRFDTFD